MAVPNTPTDSWRPDRRTFLVAGGAVLAAACTGSDDAASTATTVADPPEPAEPPPDDDATSTPDSTAPAADDDASTTTEAPEDAELLPLTPAMFETLAVCTLSNPTTEGPFPNPVELRRRDITDGYPGHPVRVGLRVVDRACQPISGATVEIWHADATGDYSAYEDDGTGKDEGPGTTFCRGNQITDEDGIVEFHTIYPGWYSGRAVHVHVQVLVDGGELHTTQLYFDEDTTNQVFDTGVYAEFGPPDTGWSDDVLIGDPPVDGTELTLTAAPTAGGPGALALCNIGTPA